MISALANSLRCCYACLSHISAQICSRSCAVPLYAANLSAALSNSTILWSLKQPPYMCKLNAHVASLQARNDQRMQAVLLVWVVGLTNTVAKHV